MSSHRVTVALLGLSGLAGFSAHSLLAERHKSTADIGASVQAQVAPDVQERSRVASEYRGRIAALHKDIELAQLSRSQDSGAIVARQKPKTPEEAAALIQSKQIENERKLDDQLLAAGFSRERIAWLRSRADELMATRRQADTARRQLGLPHPDPESEMAYFFDEDIGLRDEIGDEEYERYRVATGRSAGVEVPVVPAGSIAEGIGLMPGDEIVAYGGKRVFNLGELNAIARQQNTLGESIVEVRRNGQLLQFAAPRGDMGLRWTMSLP